jgi:hypothetical protein
MDIIPTVFMFFGGAGDLPWRKPPPSAKEGA